MDSVEAIDIENLVRQLVNLESIIEKLFAMPNSAVILQQKILQLEEMCAKFEPNSKEADKWRDKVVDLWQRFAVCGARILASNGEDLKSPCVLVPKKQRTMKSLAAVSKSPVSKSPNTKKSVPVQTAPPPNPVLQTSPKPALLETPSALSGTGDQDNKDAVQHFPPTGVDGNYPMKKTEAPSLNANSEEYAKQIILNDWNNTLEKVAPIQTGADVNGIKFLLSMVAKAQYRIAPYQDTNLEFNVFRVAFEKLPEQMREQFLTIYQYKSPTGCINLNNLIAFLQAEIVAQHSKTVWLLSMAANANSKKPILRPMMMNNVGQYNLQPNLNYNNNFVKRSPFEQMKPKLTLYPINANQNPVCLYCHYCKSSGHMAKNCPSISQLLCFNCYDFGHTKKACKNKSLV